MVHGKASTYVNYRCRCDLCRDAWRVYHGDRMRANPQYRVAKNKRQNARRWTSTQEYKDYWKEQRKKRVQANIEFVRQYKESIPCKECGQYFPAKAMDFHHRDPQIKSGLVGRMASGGVSRKKLIEEIEKCDLLCAIHHRLQH